MRRLAWTFAARIGDKYQIRLSRPSCQMYTILSESFVPWGDLRSIYRLAANVTIDIPVEII